MHTVECSSSYKYYYYASQWIPHGGSGVMAGIHVQPPNPFKHRNLDDKPCWKHRFQQFQEATGLADATASNKVSTILYCLGDEVEEVLSTTNPTTGDRSDYDRAVAKFDYFFQVRKNVIYEHVRFKRRNQQSGESLEQFIMAFYSLAESCMVH